MKYPSCTSEKNVAAAKRLITCEYPDAGGELAIDGGSVASLSLDGFFVGRAYLQLLYEHEQLQEEIVKLKGGA